MCLPSILKLKRFYSVTIALQKWKSWASIIALYKLLSYYALPRCFIDQTFKQQ